MSSVKGSGAEGRITEHDVRTYAEARKALSRTTLESVAASSAASRKAEELGNDLAQVKGTGSQEHIIKEAAARVIETVAPSMLSASAGPSGAEVEWLDLNLIQRLTGQRMLDSVQTAPHFALSVDVDMTYALNLQEAWKARVLKETGARLTVTGILVKVVASALSQVPRANASYDSGRIKLHRQVNVGVALAIEEGLVVPVIREADKRSLAEITRALKQFQEKASKMRLTAEDLEGGTFTISNLGMFGIDRFSAIINPPESAILAVGRIAMKPVGLPDNTIALRPIMALTLSIDHRSMDGVPGAKFLGRVQELLKAPKQLVD